MMKFLEDLQEKHYAVAGSGDGSILVLEDKLEQVLHEAGLLSDDDWNDSVTFCEVANNNEFHCIDDFGNGCLFKLDWEDVENVSFDVKKYFN